MFWMVMALFVDDGILLPFIGEAHFFDGEVAGFGAGDGDLLGGWDGFVVEVEVGEFAACLGEAQEVAWLFDEGDAGEHLFQVVVVIEYGTGVQGTAIFWISSLSISTGNSTRIK